MARRQFPQMQPVCVIMTLGTLAWNVTPAIAQQAVDLSGDRERMFSLLLLDQSTPETELKNDSLLGTISAEELTALRASGVDPSWVTQSFAIPEFNPNQGRVLQGDSPVYVDSWVNHHSDGRGLALSESLRFKVGRTTDLSDGNISGSAGGFGESGDDHVASISQSEGEYDLYDLSLQWDAVEAGPVKLSLLSGLKAIEANIAKRVKDSSGNTSIDSEHRVTALPMVGSGVSWQISEDFSIHGSALTQPIESGDALIDFNAATDLRITRNIGFVAGYRIIRSTFDVGDLSTELTQEGLFARLQISF